MAEYLERKSAPSPDDLSKRLAEIALNQLLLASEKRRIEHQLGITRLNNNQNSID